MRWLAIIVLGLILGVGAAASGPYQELSYRAVSHQWTLGAGRIDALRVVSIVLNLVIAWIAFAFVAGKVSRSSRQALCAGPSALYAAIASYYVFVALQNSGTGLRWSTLAGSSLRWLVAATIAGPVFGLLGRLSRRAGWLAAAAGLTVPAVAVLEVFGRVGISLHGFAADPLRAWTMIGVLTVSVLAAAVSLRHAKT